MEFPLHCCVLVFFGGWYEFQGANEWLINGRNAIQATGQENASGKQNGM